jgi:TonB family protein
MKTVASGFLDLLAATAPPPAPVTLPPPAAPQPPRIHTAGEPGITPPEIIDQTLPVWQPDASYLRTGMTLRGTVEVIIDETGSVESASLISKIQPDYDNRLLRAARAWKYRPARQNGSPVKFRKFIEVTLKPS